MVRYFDFNQLTKLQLLASKKEPRMAKQIILKLKPGREAVIMNRILIESEDETRTSDKERFDLLHSLRTQLDKQVLKEYIY